MNYWFSDPQISIESAQALHQPSVLSFDPAAVFENPDGQFVMALLHRNTNWPPHETAKHIKNITGYKMVSCCDPIFGIWKGYEPE